MSGIEQLRASLVMRAILAFLALTVTSVTGLTGAATAEATTSNPVASQSAKPSPDPTLKAEAKNPLAGEMAAATASFQSGAHLYLGANAPLALEAVQRTAVANDLGANRTPVFVAIMAPSAGKPSGSARILAKAVGKPGTYLTVIGTSYDSYSTIIKSKPALIAAFRDGRNDGTAAVITRFTELSTQYATGTHAAPAPFPFHNVALVLLLVGLTIAAALGLRRLRS